MTPEGSATTGADLLVKALIDEEVEVVFGYPGGAVLPIYDSLFKQNRLRHILVRHEQAAVHAAEGYARSTGKIGVVLVTSGPGATNAVTGLTDALMDSVPIVCLTGQVPTHLIGNDAFQEADTTGITRPCTKHNYLVKSVEALPRTVHEAFYVARTGRPGPVVIDLPKDVLMNKHDYVAPKKGIEHKSYKPQTKPDAKRIEQAIELIAHAKRPVFYTGGGVVNAGPKASKLLTQFVHLTGFPITNTLMGLGGYPASDKQFLGMLGMHGTYEANLAMHGCDVLICVGARFDDRVTGKIAAFAPNAKKIHIDIDPSSINKNVVVDFPIVGDVAQVLRQMLKVWRETSDRPDRKALAEWWKQIGKWRARNCLAYETSDKLIKPRYALQRLAHHVRGKDTYITTEVGQHQMWAAQFLGFEKPRHWLTSGGLGTMGYGLPAAIGAQVAHPDALVVDVAGEASILMNIQEMSTAVQFRLPVKVFILNNQYMGMVRQWQQLLHGNRISESYTAALPDFVKLAEAYGGIGIGCDKPAELDESIMAMLSAPADKPVLFDCRVAALANCFPMIPSGKAHHEMLLGEDVSDEEIGKAIGKEGR